jgi:RNA polymerase sigma-70 factor (ECF subfamily)
VRGDRDAFVAAYRALHPTVARFVARRVPVRADAEDLVARTFTRMVERLDSYDPERGTPEAWVLTMARSIVIDHQRRHAKVVALTPATLEARESGDASCYQPLESVARDQARELLRSAVLACSAGERELLTLRFGDGLRHREIAAILGISEPAVRKRLSRVLSKLRELLDQSHGDSEVDCAAQ